MNLQKILFENSGNKTNEKMITFYHVSTDVNAFKSFFREGAKAIGTGMGGQTDGFYVWVTEKAADRHILFLDRNPKSEKELVNKEAIIIGVKVPIKTVSYPLYQLDKEASRGLFRLFVKYGDFINDKAHDLDIPFSLEEKPFGWDFSKFTGFSFEKRNSNLSKKNYYHICFNGLNEQNKEKMKALIRGEDILDEDGDSPEDSVKFQVLTDWLCQNNSDFKKEYDALMHENILKGVFAFKYTGSEPLPVAFAKHVKVGEDDSLSKTTVFDAEKKTDQICPFITMGLARKNR